jgi:SRSO17 transposase
VAKAEWSDQEMLRRVCQWVVPQMDFSRGGWWIIDDTGFPKKGKHSVGVTRQFCGMLGKQDNCQVAVSVSLACDQGSVPVAWQLYLPEDWAVDPVRRQQAGVPEDLRFATKTQIALSQPRALLADGAPYHCVLADAGYGVDTGFRQALSDLGLLYAVGVTSAVSVWPPGVEPLPPKRYSGTGRPPVMPRRTAKRQPMSVKALALSLPAQAFQTISWREGTNEPLVGRFAALRVRHAGGNAGRARLRPLEWLLIEWPAHEQEPSKYVMSTLPTRTHPDQRTGRRCLSTLAHRAWLPGLEAGLRLGPLRGTGLARIPPPCQSEHCRIRVPDDRAPHCRQTSRRQKNFTERQMPALSKDYIPRGSPASAAARGSLDHDAAAQPRLQTARPPRAVPLLRQSKHKATFVTQ